MISKPLFLKSVATAALFVVSGASLAGPTLYTTAASFAAATTAPGVDTYTGFSIVDVTESPITRIAGAYTYTATAENGFFGAGTTGNPWLSTNLATDPVTFSGFTTGVNAIGGNFFGSNIAGSFLAGDISLTATDSTGSTSFTITGATTSSFLGFVSSTGGLTSVVVTSVQAASPLWPTIDNLTLAKAAVAAVPEPETYALMLAGLAALGFVARRRKA